MQELLEKKISGKEITIEDLQHLVETYVLLVKHAHDSGGKKIIEWWNQHKSGNNAEASRIMLSIVNSNAQN